MDTHPNESLPGEDEVQTFADTATHKVGSSAPLYAKREKIHPKRAEGRFRRLKWIIMAITLGIYYVTPWLRWDRGPYAPDQAVLVDLANRRFYFFFIEIWPQEFYYVAGLLVMAGIGLFLITSVVGRAWCGYTCPQTVWTDLFLWVERAVEGDRNARMRLDKAPMDAGKLVKRVTKHAIWLLIAVATGGAWIFYFADAPTLLRDVVTGDAPFVAYGTIAVLAFTTYSLGGLMREQVCIYMCPWPRIQAAMLDEDSLTVTYNDWRGEPRSKHQKKAIAAGEPVGDCIDCNACVAVCPMGIDIREGQQLGCITCALCIDACDGVMDKIGRERGLIAYATFRDYHDNMEEATNPATGRIEPARVRDQSGRFLPGLKHFDWRIIFRPRTLIYFAAWAAIGLGLVTALTLRERLQLNVQHDRNPVYVTLKDGSIRNGYTVKLLNMVPEPREITLSLEGLPGATMHVPDLGLDNVRSVDVPVEPDLLRQIKVFVSQPGDKVENGKTGFDFLAKDVGSDEADRYDAVFEAPEGR
ncbi:MAG: cytochrome c oxidase accessory protein CcoG [Fulvimarina manganoxydans]|uniref:cytochrome c oxidase accessory protein CcoG n=1 Tax=Fulvimarina manganoxydans TaxID=937218 RepID=UPI0023552817|nr:cytochrome c oxidase accessory protein CcoG [Fulvimarina manganoxydans]MCK5934418.1 cytochrome c oxidase accessory protein CcoG [Fulvimarina manganoxydans]